MVSVDDAMPRHPSRILTNRSRICPDSGEAAINAPLQGAAADIVKRAMIRVPPALATAGLAARMLLQVHDELLFEVEEGEVQAVAACVKRVMEGAARLSVPLVVDTGWGQNWNDAH